LKYKPLITIVLGTRPEAIKFAPLIIKLRKEKSLRLKIILTGQHNEMVSQVMDLFKIKEDINFKIMQEQQSLTDITLKIIASLRKEFALNKPDLLLVQGDTNTAFTASLVAFYERINIGHLEAGLRTSTLLNPFPEEANRRLISQISTLHFAPSKKALENLRNSNIKENIFLTGNTVIDAMLYVAKNCNSNYLQEINLSNKKIILATVHRRENWGKNLENICYGLLKIINNNPDLFLLMPVHKNKIITNPVHKILGSHPNIKLTSSLSYNHLVEVIKNCIIVLTDSGGLQEEAPSLGKPVLVLRDQTERVEALEYGTAKLVGTDTEKIFITANSLLNNHYEYNSMANSINPYGNGNSCQKIIDICKSFLNIS